MPTFNPTIRDYIFVEFKITRNSRNNILVSLFPFILSIIICTLLPDIILIWNILGVTVYNFNGYIIPLMLKMNYLRQNNKSYWKYACGIGLCVISMLIYLGDLIFRQFVKSKNKDL